VACKKDESSEIPRKFVVPDVALGEHTASPGPAFDERRQLNLGGQGFSLTIFQRILFWHMG
jgi:hypothetical protein